MWLRTCGEMCSAKLKLRTDPHRQHGISLAPHVDTICYTIRCLEVSSPRETRSTRVWFLISDTFDETSTDPHLLKQVWPIEYFNKACCIIDGVATRTSSIRWLCHAALRQAASEQPIECFDDTLPRDRRAACSATRQPSANEFALRPSIA